MKTLILTLALIAFSASVPAKRKDDDTIASPGFDWQMIVDMFSFEKDLPPSPSKNQGTTCSKKGGVWYKGKCVNKKN